MDVCANMENEKRDKMFLRDLLLCGTSVSLGVVGKYMYNGYRLKKLGLSREQIKIFEKVFQAAEKWESEHSEPFRLPRYPGVPGKQPNI